MLYQIPANRRSDRRVNMYRKGEVDTSIRNTTTHATTQSTTQADLSEKDKAVLNSLAEDPRITQKEIAVKLGCSIDQIKYYLHKMKKKGIIKRVGTSQNGYWEIRQ